MEKFLNLFPDTQGVIRSHSHLADTEKFEFDQRQPLLLPSSLFYKTFDIIYT